jgi:methionine--tRNA ligase beta chain
MNQLKKDDDHNNNNNIVSIDGNSKTIVPEEGCSGRPAQQLASDEKETNVVERLDIRVGKVVSVKVHPDADSMYIEEIDVGDVGEDDLKIGPRTIVSGLRNHVSIEDFPKFVLVLCNLKPRKLRGVLSNGMVLCACNEDHSVVEVLTPTFDEGNGSEFQGGEGINIDGFYMTNPDFVLKPKKKYWEKCEPDMKSNEDGVASYRGVALTSKAAAFRPKSLTTYSVG